MSVLLLVCGFTGKAAGCESVYTLPLPTSTLGKLSYVLLRVGQPRLMPRAEKRVFCVHTDPAKHSRSLTRCWQN